MAQFVAGVLVAVAAGTVLIVIVVYRFVRDWRW